MERTEGESGPTAHLHGQAHILDQAHLFIRDLDDRITHWNKGAQLLYGFEPQEAIGVFSHTLLHTVFPEPLERIRETLMRAGKWQGELVHKTKDGKTIVVTSHWILHRDEEQHPVSILEVNSDFTDRKQMEVELRENREELRRALEFDEAVMTNMGEGLYTVNCEGLLTTMNPAAEMLFGWRRDELLGRKMHDITHYKHRDGTAFPAEACAGLQVLRRGTLLKDHADVFIRKDGTFFDVVYSSSPIRERGQIVGVVVVFRDVTESNNLITSLSESEARFRQLTAELELRVAERTQELTESQERLRALTADLNLTEHRERSRLATELHDHLAQILSYGLLTLQRARGMAVVIPQCAGLLKDTEDALTKSLTYTRTLIVELSPPMLRERGLGAAVRWLGEQMKKYDLLVSIEAPESAALTMAEDRAALLLQSVRELLINIAKHAQTDQATVNLQCQDGMLRVEVRDKGCGFDLLYAATSAPTITSTKFGLFSIHERMKAVGGSLRMVSVKGNGTTATLTLPLDTPAESKA